MWRPLIRLFRRWLKKEALSLDVYENIRENDISLQGMLFSQALGLPQELASELRTQMAVMLLVSSHRIMWRKQLIPPMQQMIAPFHADIWPIYFKIFNETNNQ